MTQQKALLLQANGDFVLTNKDIPSPGPGELLSKIQAAALNPVDWKIGKPGHRLFSSVIPAILGYDIAGVVEEVGEGVTGFVKGDRILYQGTPVGGGHLKAGFQQYNIAVAKFATKIPPALSFEQAATVYIGLGAAFIGLYHSKPNGAGYEYPWGAGKGKYAGTPLLVIGGASSVGQFTIQLAKLSGFSPIIATASAKNTELLTSLGATHVIDRATPLSALSDEVKKITSTPLQIAFDAISSPETQAAAYAALASGGTIAVVMPSALEKADDKTIVSVAGVLHMPQNHEIGAELASHLTALLEDGSIKPNKVEVLPNGLEGVVGGLRRLELGEVSAVKLVVRPQDSK